MADGTGMADIRGIDIDKAVKGFAEEEFVFKRYVTNSTTSAREIRWYQKTTGYLTATTPAVVANVSQLSKPTVLGQTFTRNTSYVRKYFVESEIISDEDIRDSDPDVLAWNLRDLTRAVAYQVDARVWDILTESRSVVNINSVTANAAWDTASGTGVDIIEDLLEAKQKIREAGYNPEGAYLFLSPKDYKSMITWIISIKGSSIPNFAAEKVQTGVVLTFLGLNVVVSTNVTADYALVSVAERACTWKAFVPITAKQIEEVGIGIKIRVWEEGEAILTDPKCCTLISNTQA